MNVMIVGGTSGIGLALARHYLERGARVAVCGRRLERLDPALRARYPALHAYRFDVVDAAAVDAAVADFARGGLDLLVVSAGCYADAQALAHDPAMRERMMAVNVNGLLHCFDAAARIMRQRGGGQLVALASIAGLLRAHPGGSLYSANKRTVIALCALYRQTLAPYGIGVTTIVPGYVDTARLRELNGGDASGKPFLLSEDAAVAHIAGAIQQRRAMAVFPWQLHWMVRLFNLLPGFVRGLRKK